MFQLARTPFEHQCHVRFIFNGDLNIAKIRTEEDLLNPAKGSYWQKNIGDDKNR